MAENSPAIIAVVCRHFYSLGARLIDFSGDLIFSLQTSSHDCSNKRKQRNPSLLKPNNLQIRSLYLKFSPLYPLTCRTAFFLSLIFSSTFSTVFLLDACFCYYLYLFQISLVSSLWLFAQFYNTISYNLCNLNFMYFSLSKLSPNPNMYWQSLSVKLHSL